jgi:hypothetical protein
LRVSGRTPREKDPAAKWIHSPLDLLHSITRARITARKLQLS